MHTRKVIVFVSVLIAFLLQACGPDVQAGIATGIAQTQQISALQTAAAGGAPVQSAAEAGQPSDTPTPSVPFVSVSKNTNCRSGPRADYTLLTTINIGQQVEVLKTFSQDYVLIKNPNGNGDCWLFLQFADTADFGAFNLLEATQPPTPTATNTPKPSFDWSGTWIFYQGDDVPISGSINQSGNSISVSISTFTFSASLSADHQTATGALGSDSLSPTFVWQINARNMNQFVGSFVSYDRGGTPTTSSWCGSRGGAPKPNPCFGP